MRTICVSYIQFRPSPKQGYMKLSNVLMTTLLLSSTGVIAQEEVKRDTIKKVRTEVTLKGVKRKATVGTKFDAKVKTDTTKVDSSKIKPIPISPDYCPPCGMG